MRTPLSRLVLLGLGLGAWACGKSATAKRAEIQNCSAITLDAGGISRCLVTQYRWKQTDAAVAGQLRQRELDSIATRQHDSTWTIDAARHQQQLVTCNARQGDVGRCLTDMYGWDAKHASATFDSVWSAQAPRHAQEIRSCQRGGRGRSSTGSCLILYFKWDPRHALAVNDSIERARLRVLNQRGRR